MSPPVETDDAEEAARRRLVLRLGAELSVLVSEARAFSAQAAQHFEPELSSSAFQILLWIHAHGASRASQLAEGLAMDRSVVSRLLKQLRLLDLVTVMPDELDRRGVVATIKDTARGKVADAMARKGGLFEARFRDWPQADIEKLTALIGRLNRHSGLA